MATEDDPKAILALKDELLNIWGLLPVEHQATLLLVLLERVQTSVYNHWMSEVIQLLSERKTLDTPNAKGDRPFPIPFQEMSITRADIREHVGIDAEGLLTDKDMHQLAIMLGRIYVGTGMIWNDLELFVQEILEDKNPQ
jgi:hypothetical protein